MRDFHRPTMLMILDGFGEREETKGNAIAAANKPHLDQIFTTYPHTTIKACGLNVGLPDGLPKSATSTSAPDGSSTRT